MKKIFPLLGNSQKLDGGAMFGNAPKAVWENWFSPDSKNRIALACRAMLIQDGKKNILFETGVGAFFPPKLKDRYGVVEDEHILLNSLREIGISDNDIDFVVLSHLHFDHAGGLLNKWHEGYKPKLLFPNAKFIVSGTAFDRACNPHPRDKASFIPELPTLLKESSRLVTVETSNSFSNILGEDYSFHISDGHTPGMLLSEITNTEHGTIIFCSRFNTSNSIRTHSNYNGLR